MNKGTEKVIAQICDKKIKIVSFDVFDTLILRPVFKPTDMFVLMHNDFKKLMPDYEHDFTIIRMASEKAARLNSDTGEVTIDEIYDEMSESYNIPSEIALKLKNTEISLETAAGYARKSGKTLYDAALENGKKIILATDMYLPEKTIKEILDKNGYKGYDKLFLSCVLNKNKCTGTMYHHILEEYKIDAAEMLHIGDNYNSDILKPRELGIQCCYMPSPAEIMKNAVLSTSDEKQYFNARCRLMSIANNSFDDPFQNDLNEDVLTKRQTDDGLAEKINSILPVGSKKRKMAENIAHIFFGK